MKLSLIISNELDVATYMYVCVLPQVKCSLSNLVKREPEGHLFKQVSPTCKPPPNVVIVGCLCAQLLERLKFYAGFEINDQSGSSLTDHDMTDVHYKRWRHNN